MWNNKKGVQCNITYHSGTDNKNLSCKLGAHPLEMTEERKDFGIDHRMTWNKSTLHNLLQY